MKYKKISSFPLFISGQEGYHTFRIPALITLPKGRILAFAEGRRLDANDAGDIDLVLKISDDGGQTFGPLKVVAASGGNTAGNPCPIYDKSTGQVVLMFNRNQSDGHQNAIEAGKSARTVHITFSADGGDTWQPERDITVQTKLPNWTWHAVGPNHGMQLASGRLLVPCNHSEFLEDAGKSGPYRSHTLYSDDHGATWQIGEDIADHTTECVVSQLQDGRILINIRLLPCPGCRSMATSFNEGVSFVQHHTVEAQPDPGCQGSMYVLTHQNQEYVLVTNASSVDARRRLVLHESTDGGEIWTESFVITEGPCAYSDLAQLDDSHIAVLYEAGQDYSHETITFDVVALN